MAVYYPPVGFHFEVNFGGISDDTKDYHFQSVSGLSVDIETEDYPEGGENRFKHKLPGRTKFPNLILKRGMLVDSQVIQWCRDAIENYIFDPIDLTVSLLNEKHEPLVTWNIVHAFPIKWAVDDFSAEESKLSIETIELAYNYFTLV